jgi:NAD(P)-dependent dehydrogenase (short-subunit alcohol dehydrogenase family)
MIRFDGQVALVTGSGRGLGCAYARLLASRGARVVVHDAGVGMDGSGSDPGVAAEVVDEITRSGGRAVACTEDLGSPANCEAIVAFVQEKFARLDVLIHNAGLVAYQGIEATDPPTWDRMLRVNVEAPFWLSRAAFPIMRRQGYGRIVLTISGVAMYREAAQPDLAAYSVGKAAQFGLMNALAAEGEAFGIRVNAISPVAATRMLRREVQAGELSPDLVAPGVAFLASERCDFSGAVLRAADGRFSAARYTYTEGMDFGRRPAVPEAIAENWGRISAGLPPLPT